jgi:molybdopterin-guanine dinucleotide biosynthesis protein A
MMNPPTTGVVLAGGQGRRMQGNDKGLLLCRGRPLAAHALESLRPQVPSLLIVANRNQSTYAALGAPVVADTVPGFRGPLAGLLAGLLHATTDWAVFVPCDALQVPGDLVRRLHRALAAGGYAAYARSGGDELYTCCLLHRSLADRIKTALDDERLSLRAFLSDGEAAAADFPDWAAAARNINTPAELQRAALSLGAAP